MDRTVVEGFEKSHDISRRLGRIKSICNSDPVTIWEEDGERIKMLTEIAASMKARGEPGAERMSALLEVLKWKRCDLGRWLLQNTPSDDGQSIWSELIELNRRKAGMQSAVD